MYGADMQFLLNRSIVLHRLAIPESNAFEQQLDLLERYRKYLLDVRRLVAISARGYVDVARAFAVTRIVDGELDWKCLRPEHLVPFALSASRGSLNRLREAISNGNELFAHLLAYRRVYRAAA
jgi:hypothetical protein